MELDRVLPAECNLQGLGEQSREVTLSQFLAEFIQGELGRRGVGDIEESWGFPILTIINFTGRVII
jgi:hypothetical protein